MESEHPLPRPTVVAGARSSSRSSSRGRSLASSTHASRSASPAHQPNTFPRNPSAGPSTSYALRNSRSTSQERAAATASTSIGTETRSTEQTRVHSAADASDLIVISSDSSDGGDDDDDDDFVAQWPANPVIRPPPSDVFQVMGIRRAQPSSSIPRGDLFSPPAPAWRPTEPILFASTSGDRSTGVSADPTTGDFLVRPMPVVRPNDASAYSDPDGSFSMVSAHVAAPAPPRPPRSEHPITDQRLRSSNLAMPTKSPPRSKPPPIEHPLLSTYTCPICFDAPTNLSVTPCGHFFCGDCLFQALKTQAVQRGAMEEEASILQFGGFFSSLGPAATFGTANSEGGPFSASAPSNGAGGGGRGGASTGADRGGRGGGGNRGGYRDGSMGGGRGRNKPDPLAGQCPVCRAKIKGAFNGREKNGIVGLRLTVGKPVNDPRQENGQMKGSGKEQDDESSGGSESDDEEEVMLPISKKADLSDEVDTQESKVADESPRAARRRQRSANNTSGSDPLVDPSPTTQGKGSQVRKRRRNASDSSSTQTE